MNANVVVSLSLVVVGACVGIFVWMQANGLGTDDIAFIDACYGKFGEDSEECATFAEGGIEWDTAFVCDENFPDNGHITMRGLFDAWEASESETAEEGESAMDAYIQSACKAIDEEQMAGPMPDWSDTEQPEGVPGEGDEITDEWIAGGGGRKLVVNDQEERKEFFFMAAIATFLYFNRHDTLINFEGICSANWDMVANGNDSAECSGLRNYKCQAYQDYGPNYWRTSKPLGRACIDHDVCLQKGQNNPNAAKQGWCNDFVAAPANNINYRGNTRNCDVTLRNRASHCAWAGGGSNRWHCTQVAGAMAINPNGGFCECRGTQTKKCWWYWNWGPRRACGCRN